MTDDSRLTRAVKALRAVAPINRVATATARAILRSIGVRSEFVIAHLPRVGPVKCRLPNGRMLRLWSLGDDWITNQVFWRGWDGYEPEMSALFFRFARRARVTLDIGAHVGYHSLLAAHANPANIVYAFEPMARIHERLRRHVALNALGNIRCVAAAVGDRDGTAEIFSHGTEIPCAASLSYDFTQMEGPRAVDRARVPVITIDAFLRQEGGARVDLVKIDAETQEPQVLRGMITTLRRHRPDIFCEVLAGEKMEKPLEHILRPLGYRFYLLRRRGPEACEHIVGDPEWRNYLFSPRPRQDLEGAG